MQKLTAVHVTLDINRCRFISQCILESSKFKYYTHCDNVTQTTVILQEHCYIMQSIVILLVVQSGILCYKLCNSTLKSQQFVWHCVSLQILQQCMHYRGNLCNNAIIYVTWQKFVAYFGKLCNITVNYVTWQ